MKIVALVRTFNEAHRIEKFCAAYQFADEILVADGGSTDNTVEIARQQPKTTVRYFLEKVKCANGIWRNPDGRHLNFLYDWAHEVGADWVISQDCDQRPNANLKRDVRAILENSIKPFLMVTQIYLWKRDFYFPKMSRSEQPDSWYHGLWAWKAEMNLRAIDKMPHYEFSIDGGNTSFDPTHTGMALKINPPYCFLHDGWETEEMVNNMVHYYRKSGLIPGQLHPLEFCGEPQTKLDWMVE